VFDKVYVILGQVLLRLAQTDPALYRELREQITRFFLRGGDVFSLEKLEARARG